MNKLYTISQAATHYGISSSTLRRWEREGKLIPDRTKGKQRRYKLVDECKSKLQVAPDKKVTVAYARVSSHDQKADLERQKQLLEMYCAS